MRIGKERQMLNEVYATKTLRKLEWKTQKSDMMTLWARVRRIDYDMLRELAFVCRQETSFCVSITVEGKYLRIEVY
jgi:hypothetical protein